MSVVGKDGKDARRPGKRGGGGVRGLINSGLSRWRLHVYYTNFVPASGRTERSLRGSTRISLSKENARTDA